MQVPFDGVVMYPRDKEFSFQKYANIMCTYANAGHKRFIRWIGKEQNMYKESRQNIITKRPCAEVFQRIAADIYIASENPMYTYNIHAYIIHRLDCFAYLSISCISIRVCNMFSRVPSSVATLEVYFYNKCRTVMYIK